jgi:hypothetical protein
MTTQEEINSSKERLIKAMRKTAEIIMEQARSMQPEKKLKKSGLIMIDVCKLQQECFDLRHVSKSEEARDALDYVIGELHNIIHKEY